MLRSAERDEPTARCARCGCRGIHATDDECLTALRARVSQLQPPPIPPVVAPVKLRRKPQGTQGPRDWLTIRQACELLDVHRSTLWNWIKDGKIDYQKTAGGAVRIRAQSLWRKD